VANFGVSAAHAARRRLLDELGRVPWVCTGTLNRRFKRCGKKACRCRHEEKARHGPYYEWGRLEGGKLVQRTVTPTQARRIVQGLRSARSIRRRLRQWERCCAGEILAARE
jgi:hypothetical protein